MRRLLVAIDRFTLMLVATVSLATLLPAQGQVAVLLGHLATAAIALLFFLHGAKLSREAMRAGASHWRLHLSVFASTFVLFPLFGLVLRPLLAPLVTPDLYLGILFLCALPSTVQSSIAFTSIARGNVPAAVCSASASSLIGILVTPLLTGLLLGARSDAGDDMLRAVLHITTELLLPFAAGQVARRWIGTWLGRHASVVRAVDQGSILLVVYVTFSGAVLQGLWHQIEPTALLGVLLINAVLLALALLSSRWLARRWGFGAEDEIATVFCGSKKSLASGVPMAGVLFAGHSMGVMLLPLMLFHQMQLMVCAVLARRYAARS